MIPDPKEVPWVKVYEANKKQIQNIVLIFESQFLPYRVEKENNKLTLWVPDFIVEKARLEIENEQIENPPQPKWKMDLPPVKPQILLVLIPPFLGTSMGVLSGNYDKWKSVGATQAEWIREGALERCVTALTLHADTGHLFSNLIAAWFFVYFLQNHLSLGMISLLAVLLGSLANGTEAISLMEHRSLGFSTATFAMLGLLIGIEALKAYNRNQQDYRPWFMPLAGGFLLAVLTGVSPDVDLLAHALGFGWGVVASYGMLPFFKGANRTGLGLLILSYLIYVLAWIRAW